MSEKLYRRISQTGNIDKNIGIWMTVKKRIGKKEHASLRVDNVHGSNVIKALTNANNIFGEIDGIEVFPENTGNKCIRVARLHHHHPERVAVKHLLGSFLKSIPLAAPLFRKQFRVMQPPGFFPIVAEINNFYSL